MTFNRIAGVSFPHPTLHRAGPQWAIQKVVSLDEVCQLAYPLHLASQVFDAGQTLRLQLRIEQCLLHYQGFRHVPINFATNAMLGRRLQAHVQGQQILEFRAHPSVLFLVAQSA